MVNIEGHNVALPHTLEVIKVLRNLGSTAPSPIKHYYDWPRPARFKTVFEHQFATADFLTLNKRCFVLSEMGTSKTSSCLWAVDYLMHVGVVKKCMIVAPLSTLEMVWLNEIFDVCMHRTALVLHASAEKRRELLAKDVDFYIVNHDGLKVVAKEVAARKDINLVICDEVSAYRNAGTEKYKVMQKTTKDKMFWGLSGTPCPNAPTDAWALARLVDPTRVPSYFSSFRRMTMNQITQFKWAPKPDSHITAYNALQPAIRFAKKDCLDLPPMIFEDRQCDLSKEQEDAYKKMKNTFAAEADGQQITAVNAADKISKLRQILCGAIRNSDTEEYIVLPHEPRLKILLESIEEARAKVLVIVPFKGIIQSLHEDVMAWHKKEDDGKYCEIVNGDVGIGERNRIFQAFRDDPNLNELICHPKVMAHGLNMTQADMLVFYAPIYSNEETRQVMERLARPGQTRKMTCIRICANALEKEIYRMVDGRQESQQSILEMYRKEVT